MDLKAEAEAYLKFKKEGLTVKEEYVFTGNKGPIVGIHGLLGGWTQQGMVGFMRDNQVSGLLLSVDPKRGITEFVPFISSAIEHHPNSTVVGFSAGGLLALMAIQEHGLWERVHKVVTIATPFDGIPTPFGLIYPPAKDVAKGSKPIDEIRQINPPPGKVISIFAEHDMYIPNPKKIILPWQIEIVGARSHGEVQNNKEWYESTLLQCINSRK